STAGPRVRFLRVTIAIGQGGLGKSTGSTLSGTGFACQSTIELGNAATYRPVANSWLRSAKEKVCTLISGIGSPFALKASSTSKLFQLLGGNIQGTSASSAS